MRSNSNRDGQVAFSPAGDILAAGTNDWTVALWHPDPADAVGQLCAFAAPAERLDKLSGAVVVARTSFIHRTGSATGPIRTKD